MKVVTTYINEALEELRHVRWPTRQQAVRLSVIVFLFTAACAVAFGFVDFILSEIVQGLLSITY